jgi:hypothetical protein
MKENGRNSGHISEFTLKALDLSNAGFMNLTSL